MGHFSTDTYERIAATLGLEIVQIMRESEEDGPAPNTGPNPDNSLAHLAAKAAFVVKMALKHPASTASMLVQKPGKKILAVLKKPAG